MFRPGTANEPSRRRRRGASTVEFAIILPLFILLVFGMLEFGRFILLHQVVSNCAREGARHAAQDEATVGAVTATIDQYMTDNQISNYTVSVHNPTGTSIAALNSIEMDQPVSVTVDVLYRDASWLPFTMILNANTRVSSTATMRREVPADPET